jgi:hypothetical protein
METIEKIDVKKMKEDIKKMVEEQKSYRLQRKYKLPEGMERTVSQSEAQWKHRANRHKLRLMYAAYGQARGKSFVQIEPDSKWEMKYVDSTYDECHPLRQWAVSIDSIVNRYKIQVPVEAVE